MARYIDADVLKTNIRVNLMPNVDVDGTVTVENAERYFLNLIDKTSTADVVEVVRCKDCKQFVEYAEGIQCVEKANGDCYIRMMYSLYKPFCSVTYDDFCSYGKRRDS